MPDQRRHVLPAPPCVACAAVTPLTRLCGGCPAIVTPQSRYDSQAEIRTPEGAWPRHNPASATGFHSRTERSDVFVFFSNRLGCFGSILVSLLLTALLILVVSLIW
jgi:hypothetical protein